MLLLRSRRFGVIAVTSVLGLGAAGSAAASDVRAARVLPVLGYQSEGDPTSLLAASAAAMDVVGVDGVNIDAAGSSVAVPDADARRQLAKAHALRKKAEFLVGNFSDDLGDFDEPWAHNLLGNEKNIAIVVRRLTTSVVAQKWDGIDVDLESLAPRDTGGFVTFLTALKKALGPRKSVSVALENFDNAGEFTDGGYDLARIGKAVDRVVLMAYDQHGFGDSGPGPVGALPWQANGLSIILRKIPAAKVDLGVAGYGYEWSPAGDVAQLSDAQARAAAGTAATWNAAAHEWTARLRDGSVIWWSDARSLRDRRPLAAKDHLHGLAVWSLGESDPL